MSGFKTSTYDPLQVQMTLNGISGDQYADGNFIELKYRAKTNEVRVGAQGDATFIKIDDTTGECKFMLKQASSMHALLTIANASDKITPGGIPPFIFELNDGIKLIGAATAKIMTSATRNFPGSSEGREEPICEWTLVLTNLVMTG